LESIEGEKYPNERRIYVMKGLTPEIVAVTFAKTSRSPKPFDEIAREVVSRAEERVKKKLRIRCIILSLEGEILGRYHE